MSSHQSYFKDNQGECGCGCGEYGTLKKPWRDGSACVARKCKCKRCGGRRSTKHGHKKQKKVAVVLGIPGANSMHPGHEEQWAGGLRVEVKSGKADTGPAFTAFLRCEQQSEASRPIGDHRPFAAVLMPQGTSDGLLICRLSSLPEVVAAVAGNWSAA